MREDPSTSASSLPEPAGGSSRGEGVVRPIPFAPRAWRRFGPLAVAGALGGLAFMLMSNSILQGRVRVSRRTLAIATVQIDLLEETVAGVGTAVPKRSVFVDIAQGGRVEQIFVGEGGIVAEGQPLLRLSNSDLELRLLAANAERLQRLDALQESRFRLEQTAAERRQLLAQLDFDIQKLSRDLDRSEKLLEERLLPRQIYESKKDELAFLLQRRKLVIEEAAKNDLRMLQRVTQLEASTRTMEASLDVIRRSQENLLVRAPVAGQLTSFTADVGQLLGASTRLGQIDVLVSGSKVRASLDEFYLSRISLDQVAVAELAGMPKLSLRVAHLYPEVRDGKFQVDFEFVDADVPALRRGQTLGFHVRLGSAAKVVALPRGVFLEQTAGRWAYVLKNDHEAVRRDIRIGRQDGALLEVLEGLSPGDRVIISSYEPFGNSSRLRLE